MNIEQIWLAYQSNLRAFLHSKVSDPADVDDLLQEVLIKTHQKAHTITDKQNIKAWLFQVTNNTVIDFYRKKIKTEPINIEDLWHTEDKECIQQLSHCIAPFIQALPTESARLLTAIDLEGQSQKEYAQKIAIPYSTLKSQVQKSRAQLRALFDKCCEFSLDARGRLAEYNPKADNCKNC